MIAFARSVNGLNRKERAKIGACLALFPTGIYFFFGGGGLEGPLLVESGGGPLWPACLLPDCDFGGTFVPFDEFDVGRLSVIDYYFFRGGGGLVGSGCCEVVCARGA